jgi:hypothetical protein
MNVETIIEKILDLQDDNGCWNVLKEGDAQFRYNYYVPSYSSTYWTLVLLADLKCDPHNERIVTPLNIIKEHFWDQQHGIFTLGRSHFPIPCLNGNMLYLLSYFSSDSDAYIESVVDFFITSQRFDDGEVLPKRTDPYKGNKSCYGKHTCYWSVVKLLKGLSFIPENRRSEHAKVLMSRCIDFILLHEVCFSSHDKERFLHPYMEKLTFPNLYRSDFLEVLWLLKREKVRSIHIKRAYELLISKMNPDYTWTLERNLKNLIVPLSKREYGNELITQRAKEVVEYYSSSYR